MMSVVSGSSSILAASRARALEVARDPILSHRDPIAAARNTARPEAAVLQIAQGLCKRAIGKINEKNKEGATFLQLACKNGHTKVVEYLLCHAVPHLDINIAQEGGFTALTYACRAGYLDIVIRLIACGAETDFLERSGRARFLPANNDIRARVLSAIKLGSEEYAATLEQQLHVLDPPFNKFPTALIPLVLEYTLRLDSKRRRKAPKQTSIDEADVELALSDKTLSKHPKSTVTDIHDDADVLLSLSDAPSSLSGSSATREVESLDEDERRH